MTGLRATAFEALYRQIAALVACPINRKLRMPAHEVMLRTLRRKALRPHTMLFLFLFVIRVGTEGSIGYNHSPFRFGISNGTVSFYIRQVRKALLESLHHDVTSIIRWPEAKERQEMRGLMYGFENCIWVIDGTNPYCFRPSLREVRDEHFTVTTKSFVPPCYCELTTLVSLYDWTAAVRVQSMTGNVQ